MLEHIASHRNRLRKPDSPRARQTTMLILPALVIVKASIPHLELERTALAALDHLV
ncbi:hypothetical protein M407DRAFT_182392 [Tulasnella calospora MUT 4182]|uniref:Uncharacterized protein n=1 Tax=Tulasnella calospora MUT 4182 TaxID=1051891 RepID=A0A0C3K5Z4_9AGAM|nr:hypothetical protein M407DRAFT_182392 [Tulasnella calospora MUT 4182]